MLIFQDRDRIVFAGDSVTDMGSVHPVGEGRNEELGTGYVRMVENLLAACYPRLRIRVTNSGVSGNRHHAVRQHVNIGLHRLGRLPGHGLEAVQQNAVGE